MESLKGKKIWLYFSASLCGPCRQFTPALIEAYRELSCNGDVEVVFVSGDRDEESFNGYFSKMPWLAIPFSDSGAKDKLNELFSVMGIPTLVMLDESGKVSTEDGVEIITEYGVDAYPFTPEKIIELKDMEEQARKEQSLGYLLVSKSRDYVISADEKKVSFISLPLIFPSMNLNLIFCVFSWSDFLSFFLSFFSLLIPIEGACV